MIINNKNSHLRTNTAWHRIRSIIRRRRASLEPVISLRRNSRVFLKLATIRRRSSQARMHNSKRHSAVSSLQPFPNPSQWAHPTSANQVMSACLRISLRCGSRTILKTNFKNEISNGWRTTTRSPTITCCQKTAKAMLRRCIRRRTTMTRWTASTTVASTAAPPNFRINNHGIGTRIFHTLKLNSQLQNRHIYN